jgi:hypothetical protein
LSEVTDVNDESNPATGAAGEAEPKTRSEPKIKKEPVDQDSGLATNFEARKNTSITSPTADTLGDAEIERKKAKLRRLAEEIEEEDRVRELKRQRRALEEDIEEAEKKKNSKK